MSIQVKNNVKWVGVKDTVTSHFHGTEYKMGRGTTYNSYLIQEEKTVLIDTVDHKFDEQFLANLEQEIDLNQIDYIITQHAEHDHAGALSALMAKIPDTPIYCTEAGVKSIIGHHHIPNWNFRTIKTGDTLDIGNGKALVFVEMRMLHWPDSMATYMTGDNILFSNDAFGQHYCDGNLFNDEMNQDELYEECQRYFSNILTPFAPLVKTKIEEVLSLGVPIDMIATSHGCIWRTNATQIVEKYYEWSQSYKEDRITIAYDTMSGNTQMMAQAIAEGIKQESPSTTINVYNISHSDKNVVLANMFRSKGVLFGSSTMNNVMMPKVAGMIEEVHGLRLAEKTAAAFGSSGWTGGAVTRIDQRLREAGLDTSAPMHLHWKPDTDGIAECIEYGKALAKEWNQKHEGVIAPAQDEEPEVEHSADCTCYKCTVCNWIYDPKEGEPNQGIEPGVAFDDLPDWFLCPECQIGKEVFVEIK
ncbi:anaerobic nitric oxide reductase flavorubredoxin [Vibrio sp. SCSIO 43140]|uniref:anaerobic nitric oxide reductase flavorubredoxin n=1 Tax=Vibrio sp. SCSIO 43140 TaxID=2819100 RepID=UPI0020758B47|nr:anaerobic nitric oxide reductase flavorubredoxin [Vibrio sp. SCSIO 43140]USD58786.1 anaerobic nitric oxide reductase flavorubredoxin [Vibrio sp. SCSIO 43140]USD59120.1 anaerobic nitric oxide reductase flavorubredoxin [Vibrio sp. SCSIO 43140]USD59727.1 anaerobic nitric oxide reductase flavorubredoxin [Vibrio sp. SCSIO 43140]